jgi:hypothetical protein
VKVIYILFYILYFSSACLATDLRFASEKCNELGNTGTFDPYQCFESFQFEGKSEINTLEATSGKMSTHLQKIGTLKNLATIIKAKFLNNLVLNYQQNLIIAQNLGADVVKLRKRIQTAGKSCGVAGSESVRDKFSSSHDLVTKNHQGDKNKIHKKKYLKKLYAAFIEANRLKTLLEQYQKYAPDNVEVINRINKDMQNLYRFFPILGHVQKNGVNGGNISKLFLGRVLTKNPRPENAYFNAYETSEDINSILEMPMGSELQTTFPKASPKIHRKNPYLYKAVHHQIIQDDFSDAMYEKRVPLWAEEAALNNIKSIDKLCDADPCDIFKMVPHEIGQMIDSVKNEHTKTALQTSICQCKIDFRDDTVSPLIHLGLIAGTIGAGLGCIAFPPACIAAAVIGLTSATVGVSDWKTVSKNNDRIINQAITNSSVSDYDKYFLEQMETLNDSNDEAMLSTILLPLEFLGAAGDAVVVVKGVGKFVSSSLSVTKKMPALPRTTTDVERRLTTKIEDSKDLRQGPRRHDADQREYLDLLEEDLGNDMVKYLDEYNPGNVHKLSKPDNIYLAGLIEALEGNIKKPAGFDNWDSSAQIKFMSDEKIKIKKVIDDVITQCKGKAK